MNKLLFIPAIILTLSACNNQSQKGKTDAGAQKTLSDDSLLNLVQYQTFQYFWDGAEEMSGMARERYHMDDEYPTSPKEVVTSGGSGFGLMAMIVGIERGFITRQEGIERFDKILTFLENADTFHGAWPHWWDGTTGKAYPFSKKDDGGDIVETSFLVQGLLTVRQYLNEEDANEAALIDRINTLWRNIEFDWYTMGEDTLHWHWSPNYAFEMDHEIKGYNECLITYVIAASSPTHPIEPSVYHEGWAMGGKIAEDTTVYSLSTVLNHYSGNGPAVGPLFWAHYSYLGMNPKGLTDRYGDYWKLNQNHALIHYKYAVENPEGYKGYGEKVWGLTSSYSIKGYVGHRPGNDRGVISPTAALSSMPYTPEESFAMLRWMYTEADTLVGEYGPYDAFSIEHGWYTPRYLAIDQGPIPVMIENYRTGLLWELFMSAPEMQDGLRNLGFTF